MVKIYNSWNSISRQPGRDKPPFIERSREAVANMFQGLRNTQSETVYRPPFDTIPYSDEEIQRILSYVDATAVSIASLRHVQLPRTVEYEPRTTPRLTKEQADLMRTAIEATVTTDQII